MATKNEFIKINNTAPAQSAKTRNNLSAQAAMLLEQGEDAVLVTIAKAQGSTPRDQNTSMLVTMDHFDGTIGGGRLEWIALESARELLSSTLERKEQKIPLGPEIGQCCGGRVELMFERLKPTHLEALRKSVEATPIHKVQIHGAGHTGKALLQALGPLPFDVTLVDGREEELAKVTASGKTALTAIPEQWVQEADGNTAFIILTHEHHLDFLIAAEALKRGDAAYVGMIGSATKRAVFTNWLEDNGYDGSLAEQLVCPIGGSHVKDKRPEVIASLVAAELLSVFLSGEQG